MIQQEIKLYPETSTQQTNHPFYNFNNTKSFTLEEITSEIKRAEEKNIKVGDIFVNVNTKTELYVMGFLTSTKDFSEDSYDYKGKPMVIECYHSTLNTNIPYAVDELINALYYKKDQNGHSHCC